MKNNKPQYTLEGWIDEINGANQPRMFTQNINSFSGSYLNNNKDGYKALVYKNTRMRLINLLLKQFKWETPDTISPRVLEMGYLTRGAVCIYQDKEGIFGLPCTETNTYNIYGDPVACVVYGYNGYTKNINIEYPEMIPKNKELAVDILKGEDIGVYGRDNEMAYPYIYYVDQYAYSLADKIVALHVATQRLKSPFAYAIHDKDTKDNVDEIVRKIESNDDIIIFLRNNKINAEADEPIKPYNVGIQPTTIQAIKDAIVFDFNNFLEIMGINTNPSPDKSQVVLTPEIDSNNNVIQLQEDIRYSLRNKLCEDVSTILGVQMSVERNTLELQKEIADFTQQFIGEDDKNGDEQSNDSEHSEK